MSKLGYGIRRGTFYKITKMKQPINKIKFLKKNSKKFYILAKSEEIQPIE